MFSFVELFYIWLTASASPRTMHMYSSNDATEMTTTTTRLFWLNILPNWLGKMKILHAEQIFNNIKRKVISVKVTSQYSEKTSDIRGKSVKTPTFVQE